MRSFVLFLCTALLFGTATLVHAFYDDSIVIEIEGIPPPEAIAPGAPGGATGGAGSGGGGGSSTGGGSSGGGAEGGGALIGTSGGYLFGFGSTQWSATLGSDIEALQDQLYELLLAAGAISGAEGNGLNTGSAAGEAGQSAVAGSITIDAAKLRSALRENSSFRQILEDFGARARNGGYQRGLSQRDFGLLAAFTVLEDASIEELTFGATRFGLVYRSRGYLLGFIPKTFSVRIAVNPQTSVVNERVVLNLPWYRFFLRKLFDTQSLVREIEAVVSSDKAIEGDIASDVQARLFEAVSLLLQEKIGTVTVSR